MNGSDNHEVVGVAYTSVAAETGLHVLTVATSRQWNSGHAANAGHTTAWQL